MEQIVAYLTKIGMPIEDAKQLAVRFAPYEPKPIPYEHAYRMMQDHLRNKYDIKHTDALARRFLGGNDEPAQRMKQEALGAYQQSRRDFYRANIADGFDDLYTRERIDDLDGHPMGGTLPAPRYPAVSTYDDRLEGGAPSRPASSSSWVPPADLANHLRARIHGSK
jgi:hypothetical protein